MPINVIPGLALQQTKELGIFYILNWPRTDIISVINRCMIQ